MHRCHKLCLQQNQKAEEELDVELRYQLSISAYRSTLIVNRRCSCAARVTVVVVCVCQSVRYPDISLHEPSIAPQTIPRLQRRIKVEKYVGFSETNGVYQLPHAIYCCS